MRMSSEKYGVIMHAIIAIRQENAVKELQLCNKLYAMAIRENDDYAIAYSCLFKSDAYLALGNINKTIEIGSKSIKLQKEKKYDNLLAMQYNILGLAYVEIGDRKSSLESYFHGLKYAEKMKDYALVAIISANLATLYLVMSAYEKAREAFEEAKRIAKYANENVGSILYTEEIHYQNLTYVYYAKKEYELALTYVRKSMASDSVDFAFYCEK